jgi:Ca2+-binding RTX toxin-like protein
MPRRTDAARLSCEALEGRDVPAIMVDATINADATLISPTGGLVTVTEVAFDEGTPVVFPDGTPVNPAVRQSTADDVVTATQSGSRLSITGSDGIYGRVTNLNNSLVFFGNSLTINGVTGLNITLQLGGNDRVTENTSFASVIDAGPGNDTVQVTGGQFRPDVALLFTDPKFFTQLAQYASTASAAKTVSGGDGNDTLLATGAFFRLNMFGNGGNDVLRVDGFTAQSGFDGGDGNDTITGSVLGLLNQQSGGAGRDTINGSALGLFSVLDGGADADTLIGGAGADTLIGGIGTDILAGLGGRDVYAAIDVDFDLVFNVQGDIVTADSFDSRATR